MKPGLLIVTCNCCPPDAELLQLFLTWGANALVVSGLGDGWTAVEVCSSEAAQLPTCCTVLCSFGWKNSAPLQPLAIESIDNFESNVWSFDSSLCLLISVTDKSAQVANFFLAGLEIIVLFTDGWKMWKWKPATAEGIFFFSTMYMSIKPELCCPGSAITAHAVVFKSFSGLENMGNSCPVTKICHNPEHVSSDSFGNMNSAQCKSVYWTFHS